MADRHSSLGFRWRVGVAAGALAISCLSAAAHAESQDATQPPASAEELQQYVLRLMLQVYDGTRDVSHTQLLGVGRVRQGDESFTQFDFGDGAVVLSENGGRLAASRFANLSSTEKAVRYDYRTGLMFGDKSVTGFHNSIVRPLLGHAPAPGRDANWVSSVGLSAMGIPAKGDANLRIELSREYFTYQGKPMVLVHYAVPAFTYTDEGGRQIVHWGQGISLTDPGFGMIYLSSTLQRAVANGPGGSVPYRYSRTMVAADSDGSALIDYRDVPQLAPYLDDLFGEEAMRVVPTGAKSSSSMPIDAARNIDIVALSLAEDAGNEAPMAAGVQLAADHGLEVISGSMMEQLQAQQAASQQQQMQQQLTSGANGNAQQAQNITNNTSTLLSDMRGQTSLGSGNNTDTTYVGGPTGTTRGGGTPLPDATGMAAQQLQAQQAASQQQQMQQQLTSGANANAQQAQNITDNTSTLLSDMRGQTSLGSGNNTDTTYVGGPTGTTRGGGTPLPDASGMTAQQLQAQQAASQQQQMQQQLTSGANANAQQAQNITNNTSSVLDMRGQSSLGTGSQADTTYAGGPTGITRGGGTSLPDATGMTAQQLQAQQAASQQQQMQQQLTSGANANAQSAQTITNNTSSVLDMRGQSSLGTGTQADTTYVGVPTGTTRGGDAGSSITVTGPDGETRSYALPNVGQELRLPDGSRVQLGNGSSGGGSISITGPNGETSTYDLPNVGQELHFPDGSRLQLGNDQQNGPKSGSAADQALEASGARAATADRTIFGGPPVGGSENGLAAQERAHALQNDASSSNDSALESELSTGIVQLLDQSRSRGGGLQGSLPTGTGDTAFGGAVDAVWDVYRAPNAGNAAAVDNDPLHLLDDAALKREQRSEQARRDLEAYQAQKRLEEAAEQGPRFATQTDGFRASQLATSALLVSSFDMDPVTFDPVVFDPVTWTPPTWTPPEWVPPTFDAPEISQFPPTDPDDLDGYPGVGSYPAFTFDSMSGTVETSLDKWAEWLATQDVAALEKLARRAGYPNLASALADSDNLLRQAADTGWRQWALAAPSCGGLAGCGPQFAERWAAKRSRLALGDLLAADRSFFSSAGLSDVQIAGLMLAFIIADYGQEDGDIVNVTVRQFGQTLLNQTLSTTNAGTGFSVGVNPGVVSVQMTAINEGEIPPNTAGLTIQGVTGGEDQQQYSLGEGDVAGLRVTVGGK